MKQSAKHVAQLKKKKKKTLMVCGELILFCELTVAMFTWTTVIQLAEWPVRRLSVCRADGG